MTSTRRLIWCGIERRILLYQAQCLSNATRKLRVEAAHIILRCVVHVDSRVSAVIFDAPAYILEPEAELRLSRNCPIDQRHIGRDTNDTAPGALADQRP